LEGLLNPVDVAARPTPRTSRRSPLLRLCTP